MSDCFKFLIHQCGFDHVQKDVFGKDQSLYFYDLLEVKIGPYYRRDPI
jgi:hypothetical protein